MAVVKVRHSTRVAWQDQNHAGKSFVGWDVDQQGPWTHTGMAMAEMEPGISVNSLCRA